MAKILRMLEYKERMRMFRINRLQLFTRDEARKLVQEHPEWTWPLVPDDKKNELRRRVNALLVNEGIPTVEDDIHTWRMSYAVRDAHKNLGTCDKQAIITCSDRSSKTRHSSKCGCPTLSTPSV